MKKFLGRDAVAIYRRDDYHEPGFDARQHLCDSVMVDPYTSTHEQVIVFSRGQVAGKLVLRTGDGAALAEALLGPESAPEGSAGRNPPYGAGGRGEGSKPAGGASVSH